MKVIVSGACGRMGNALIKLIDENSRDSYLAAGIDINAQGSDKFLTSYSQYDGEADVIIDFSHHSALPALLEYALKRNLPVVVATTGHSEDELKLMQEAAKSIPVFFSGNMSVGVSLLIELAIKTAKVFDDADIEIVETHHNRKLDAPSGTALMIANAIKSARTDAPFCFGRSGMQKRNKGEIGIHAVRRGNIVGIHEVIVSTDTQTITLKHEAHDRSLFAEGALAAAQFICNKGAGLYSMSDMLS